MADRQTSRNAATKKAPPCHGADAGPDHPDHTIHLKRLNRVKGQLEGIQSMIEDRRYCPDIVNQLKAAQAGLSAIQAEILRTHLRGCVKDAFRSKDAFQVEAKIEEVLKILF